jgi:acyl-CoA thioesterase I
MRSPDDRLDGVPVAGGEMTRREHRNARRSPLARALRRTALGLALVVFGLAAVLGTEAIVAIETVPDDGYVAPSPAPRAFGSTAITRPPLRYVVLGDSTATGEGASYDRGIAISTARELAAARHRRVTMTNLAVAGARFGDVRRDQLAAAARIRPDLVLVAVGANDVTGLTTLGSVRDDLGGIVDGLRAARCDVAIVVTGSPDVGSAPRLAQPLRTVAGWRTGQLNGAVRDVAGRDGLVFAPVAQRTGRRFRADRSLFAADGFHPSAAGYATWLPVIEPALQRALTRRRLASRACASGGARRRSASG